VVELAESVAGSAVEWAGVLETVWVVGWEWSQGELWCSPVPSLSNRTAVALVTKHSPTVRNPIRSRTVMTLLTLSTAKGEVGSRATDSEDSMS